MHPKDDEYGGVEVRAFISGPILGLQSHAFYRVGGGYFIKSEVVFKLLVIA